jgi:DNA-binding CsgD family transcriptional regulator
VGVDDVQWLDVPSAGALEFAVRRLAGRPVGIAVTVRLTDEERPRAFDRALAEADSFELRLGPLNLAGLHELLKGRLGHPFPRPTLVRIEQASGGNPFFALELGQEILRRGEPAAGRPLSAPEDMRQLVVARLRRLPAATREALLMASALSRPTIELVDRTAITAAEEAGIVRVADDGVISFVHPLLASAVYDSAAAERRRLAHQRLADKVGDLEEKARHLALVTDRPDASRADTLERAASLALSRGAPDAAAELMGHALRLSRPDKSEQVLRRELELGRYLYWSGDGNRARHVLQPATTTGPPGHTRAEALALLGWICWTEGECQRGLELCDQALANAEGDNELLARIRRRLAIMWLPFDLQRAEAYARATLDALDESESPILYAEALVWLANARRMLGQGSDDAAVEHALDVLRSVDDWNRPDTPDVSGTLGYWAIDGDDFSGGRARFLDQLQARRSYGDESAITGCLGALACIELLTGNWQLAERYATESKRVAEQTGNSMYASDALYVHGMLDAAAGRIDGARAIAQKMFEAASESSPADVVARPLCLLGFVHLSLEQYAECDRYLTQADAALEATGQVEPSDHRFHGDLVEAVVALGDVMRAERLVARLDERARVFPRPWTLVMAARSRALLAAASRNLDEAMNALDEALVQHERLDMPFELARTWLAKGLLHRRRKEKRLAKDALERARATFDGLGATLWADKALHELGRVGLRRATGDELTATEARVAELAAGGLTNREVGQRLFLSPKTVEANLARIYRKLGVLSRAELGAVMARRTAGSPQT